MGGDENGGDGGEEGEGGEVGVPEEPHGTGAADQRIIRFRRQFVYRAKGSTDAETTMPAARARSCRPCTSR